MTTNIETIAISYIYVGLLHRELDEPQMVELIREVQSRDHNRKNEHDFCDANMLMLEAYCIHEQIDFYTYEFDANNEALTTIMNRCFEYSAALLRECSKDDLMDGLDAQ